MGLFTNRSNQQIAARGIGSNDHFAQQQSKGTHVS